MNAIIVGDARDSHVAAVITAMTTMGAPQPMIIDAPSLQQEGFSLTLDRIRHMGAVAELDGNTTGWLRRYSPAGWGQGSVAGSLDSLTRRAFLTLVGSISRLGHTQWLTRLEAMLNAEDRMMQLEIARDLKIRTPTTVVTSDPDEAIELLGQNFIVKPLSMGFFRTDTGPKAVYTSQLSPEVARSLDFGSAPFMAQQLIDTEIHYRVVTVGGHAWVASLSAAGRPLDWRQQESAHSEWDLASADDICEFALRLVSAMDVGYSSQDWLLDADGPAFIDLNPGGQWLFLPDPLSGSVTSAIARFLTEGES